MTSPSPGQLAARRALTPWRGGATDQWPLLSDPVATGEVVADLAAPFEGTVDLVAGPEPGGMLLGPLVAQRLGVPFAPVCRNNDYFFQGPIATLSVSVGHLDLVMHKAALTPGVRVLLVDDWSESGNTVTGVKALIERSPAKLAAIAFLVDSLLPEARRCLTRAGITVHCLATPDQLGKG